MQAKFNTGGGSTTGKDTATTADVRDGKTFHAGKNLKPQVGTIKDCTAKNVKPGSTAQTIGKGVYLASDITIEGDSNLASANIKAGKSIFGISGDSNVIDTSDCNLDPESMLEGQKGGSKGQKVSGSIKTLTSSSFSPSDSTAFDGASITGASQNSYAGVFSYKVCGYVQNKIDIYIANLISANIRAGIKIGGANGFIHGSFTQDATASAGDIIRGKTAGINGQIVTGSLVGAGNAAADNVLTGKTFYNTDLQKLVTGTMPDRGQAQYATGFGSGNGYVAFNKIPQGYYHQTGGDEGWAPEIRMTRDNFKSNVINYFGIGSVTNFSVAQYSSQKLLFTWANPSSGKMWSGIRIVGKQGGYPSSVTDGTVICDSAAGSYVSGTLATGTWYFRAWNYVTVSEGKWYGGYSQASIYNNSISGNATFTYSQSWTVPTAVRQIQYFIVGGGGGAYIGSSSRNSRYSNGGGGGRTTTGYANVTPGQTLYITVGAGGSGGDGGSSYINGIASASGGSVGTTADGSGSGGSGGGAGTYGSSYSAGSGGSDGGNGGSVSGRTPGSGQGSSTRCPWDSVLYAGGGGGGSAYSSGGGSGGSGGGGVGGNYGPTGTFPSASNGTANTGGGGGGVGHDSSTGSAEHTDGGSGIVRIRW